MITVTLIPILDDNYAYAIENSDGHCAIVDPGEAQPIVEYLNQSGRTLTHILNTHHHGDHIGGNAALMEKYGARLIGPAAESSRIPNMSMSVSEGDVFTLFEQSVEVIETPGHTSGHICFHFPESNLLFAGDTLFSMGCGRVFEGTMEEMFNALQKLAALPDDTQLYCGHEYTKANAEFCLTIEPENEVLQKRYDEVIALRKKGSPTLPVSLGLEHQTNVFLRAKNTEEFSHRRRLKDQS